MINCIGIHIGALKVKPLQVPWHRDVRCRHFQNNVILCRVRNELKVRVSSGTCRWEIKDLQCIFSDMGGRIGR